MSTAVSPDIEKLVAAYLLGHEQIEALVEDRVGGRHPESTAGPWIKFAQIGDSSPTRTLWVTETNLQLDAYGGDDLDLAQAEASLLARTARAVLNDLPDIEHEDAVVSRVSFFGPRRVPDPGWEPARERYILDFTVAARPA